MAVIVIYNDDNLPRSMSCVEKRLAALSPYKVSCRWVDGWVLVGVIFDENWTIIDPENGNISYQREGDEHFYFGEMSKVTLDELFDAIEMTVKYNIELEKKSELLDSMVKELYELFASEDIETLRTLEFKLSKKRQKKSKKAVVQTVEETEGILMDETPKDEVIEQSVGEPSENDVVYKEWEYEGETNKPVETLEEID